MCLPGTVEAVREQIEQEGRPARRQTHGPSGRRRSGARRPPSRLPAASRHRKKKKKLRDLTHTFTEGFPVFVTGEEPERETIADYATSGFYAQRWTFGEHSGTHMDAPGHFVPGGRLSPEITLRELLVPIVVIDISRRAPPRIRTRSSRWTTCAVSSGGTAAFPRARSSRWTPGGRPRSATRTSSRAGPPSRTTTSRGSARRPRCGWRTGGT